jgi:hypothetical protein
VSFERAISHIPTPAVSCIKRCLLCPPVPRPLPLLLCPSMVMARFSSNVPYFSVPVAGGSLFATVPAAASTSAHVEPSIPMLDAQMQNPIRAVASAAASANSTYADVAQCDHEHRVCTECLGCVLQVVA